MNPWINDCIVVNEKHNIIDGFGVQCGFRFACS